MGSFVMIGPKDSFYVLKKTVIDRGLCTGCGTCISVCPNRLIDLAYPDGEPEPYLSKQPCTNCKLCIEVCPGKEIPILEIERKIFGVERDPDVDTFGIYRKSFAAHATNENIRKCGSSGGVVTSILTYALEKGIIDGAIVAGYSDGLSYRQEPKIVTDSVDLVKYARSKYGGPVPINASLNRAVKDYGLQRLAMVGCPCHVHGIRKIQLLGKPKRIATRVKLVLGLFCGSNYYFEGTRHLLAEWCNIADLGEVEQIDYRWGDWPGGFYVRTKDGKEVLVDRHQYMYHHLEPAWQRDRCMMCLDLNAELADIAFGDYWQPEKKAGELGWNIVVARTEFGLQVIDAAVKEGYIVVKEAEITEQSHLGFEMKKHGASFRHKQRKRYRLPVPNYGFSLPHEPQKLTNFTVAPSFGAQFLRPR